MKQETKTELNHFKQSLKPNIRMLYVALLELGLIATILFIYYLLTLKLTQLAPKLAGVKQSLTSDLNAADVFLLQSMQADVMSVYHTIIASIIISVIFAIITIIIFKVLIYLITNKSTRLK